MRNVILPWGCVEMCGSNFTGDTHVGAVLKDKLNIFMRQNSEVKPGPTHFPQSFTCVGVEI